MKIYSVRRHKTDHFRCFSRYGNTLKLEVGTSSDPTDDGYSSTMHALDLTDLTALCQPAKNAHTLWALAELGDRPVEFLNVYAETFLQKTPTAQFLSTRLWGAICAVSRPGEMIVGITTAEDDDITGLGFDGDLSAEQWRDLVITFLPKVALSVDIQDGFTRISALATQSGSPVDLTGVDLYWECTGGVLRASRSTFVGADAHTEISNTRPGDRVKAGFRYFSGAAEVTL